ncbi:hypothetical protein CIK62_01370 [Brevibacterium aurantiacum]|uniref:Uncharacterized protein n=1 Tax=Brevibacterium aurantiacum TaxID=273384 RepID=A0A2A3ZJP8_BREAU|nr:hypothetical protein CIK62_01370 [Brevibacterium aurantiacum]
MIIVPIEDGIRNATKNLDKAAEAAPTSEVADADDFGVKDNTAETHGDAENHTTSDQPTSGVEDQHDDSGDGDDSSH